jgi:hypothetical protein
VLLPRPLWAVELSKQLMYADGERSIDYTVMGWAMAQVSCHHLNP